MDGGGLRCTSSVLERVTVPRAPGPVAVTLAENQQETTTNVEMDIQNDYRSLIKQNGTPVLLCAHSKVCVKYRAPQLRAPQEKISTPLPCSGSRHRTHVPVLFITPALISVHVRE